MYRSIRLTLFISIFSIGYGSFQALAEELAANPAATADRLQAALKLSDQEAIRALLDENVLIFESGGVESSFEEYASHHMGSDMAFMQGIEREVVSRNVHADGGLAVVTTRSRLTGTYRDRPVNLFSNETLVLEMRDGGWHITHIHWSAK